MTKHYFRFMARPAGTTERQRYRHEIVVTEDNNFETAVAKLHEQWEQVSIFGWLPYDPGEDSNG